MRRLTGLFAIVLVVSACGGGGDGGSGGGGNVASGGGDPGGLFTDVDTAATARFMSDDGSPLSRGRAFVDAFAEELEINSRAGNQLVGAFGLADSVTQGSGVRTSHWDFPGDAFVELIDGRRITAYCGTAGVFGHVGEEILLCISTLDEARTALADGMAGFEFAEDATSDVASRWSSCDAESTFDRAILEIWVNATGAEDRGFSSDQVTGGEIINGIELRTC